MYKIFIINPGSTSTKLSLYEDEREVVTDDPFHDSTLLRTFPTINDQLPFRMEVVHKFIADHGIDLTDVAAIVGRGGGCWPVEGGVYTIDEALIADTRANRGGVYHASMLGVQMAAELHRSYGGALLMMDPPVVDEYCDLARVSGVEGIYRHPACHALNLKAVCRKQAAAMGRRYEACNFIAAHIDGGISITAHCKGRMIDGNNASGGEGPFSPTRMGSMAVTDIVTGFGDAPGAVLRNLCSQAGGLSSHFGTSSSDKVHALVDAGDPRATRIWNAMLYQTAKYIGEMAVALEGRVDAIVLTGGLLRFPDVQAAIERYCGFIAPVVSYPGEAEQEAMALGALRVLRGEEQARTYPGRPVWDGFHDET